MSFPKFFVVVAILVATCASQALEKKNFDISDVRENNVVYKIHGKNGGDEKYHCNSFEDLAKTDQTKAENAIEHSKLSSFAYLDSAGAYREENASGKIDIVTRANALQGTNYKQVADPKVLEKLVPTSSGLTCNADDGSVRNQNDPNGLYAVILAKDLKTDENGNILSCSELVISYRGTSGKSDGRDVLDDATQAAVAKLVPQQYKDSATLLQTVIANTSADIPIVCDGHSLGGGEVTYAIAATDLSKRKNVTGNTYNAAGLSESTVESLDSKNVQAAATRINNYRNEKDPVSYVGYHIGPTYEIHTSAEYSDNKHTIKNDHSIQHTTENMMAVFKNKTQSSSVSTTPSLTKTTQDAFVDMSGSGGSQYGKATQTSDGDAPANILNSAFADNPAEPKDAQTLANEAFDKEIDKIVKDVADGDQSLAQKIKDYVNGKLEDAIKKGGDWIENGGIRKTILEQVDKMIEGKVSSEDAQRIHNLVDTLCNVNEDGGESFCNTLGTDGKDLAVSLAVEALKKELSDALPEDAADMVNAMLDVLKDKGTADDYKKAVLGQIQELITKYVPYENTANTLNGIIQNISDGNAIDVMDSIKDVGKNLGVDLLKDTISKNLDPELANRINALLDGFAKDGIQGATDEALSQIYGLIDKYAPGADSAQKLKDLIKGTFNGTVIAPDFKNAATSIVADGARNLINNSNLPQGVKDAANTAVDGLMQNGVTGMTTNVRDFISDYVSDYLGDDAAGDAVGKIFDAVVTPGVDPWQEIVTQAPVIGAAIGHKVVAEVEKLAAAQIDKLIAKCPALQKVLNKLGINGAGIINGIKNVFSVLKNAPDLKTALTKLGDMAVNFLKDIAGKLIDWALEWAISWINNNIIPKVIDWASETLGRMADSTNNELLQKGLAWLADQVKNCKKCAAIKIKVDGTGAKIVNKVDQWIKSKQSTSTTVLQSNGGSK